MKTPIPGEFFVDFDFDMENPPKYRAKKVKRKPEKKKVKKIKRIRQNHI